MTEYEALNYDGTERRANYRFVSYRIDILHALDKKEAAAIIFEILYRWETDYHCKRLLKEIEARKKAGLPPLTEEEVADQMWTYMSYNDFVRESGSALGYNTVIRMLDYLIDEKGVIEQRENRDPRYPDYEYRINKEVVRKLLKDLPVSPVFAAKVPKKKGGSTQMGTPSDGSTQMGTQAQGSTQMGIGSTQMGIEVYPNGSTSQKDTENSQNEGTNADDSETESTQTDSLIPSSTPSHSLDVDNSVDNQPSSDTTPPRQTTAGKTEVRAGVEHPVSHIANPTIENAERENGESNSVESLTTGNTSQSAYPCKIPKQVTLTAEEGQVFQWLCDAKLYTIIPTITPTIKKHCATLVPLVHSLEDVQNLLAYTRSQEHLKGKAIFLANLVNENNLNGWGQMRLLTPVISFQEKKQQVKTRKQAQEEWTASLLADPWK